MALIAQITKSKMNASLFYDRHVHAVRTMPAAALQLMLHEHTLTDGSFGSFSMILTLFFLFFRRRLRRDVVFVVVVVVVIVA